MGYPKHPKMTKINGNTWNTRSKKLFLKLLKAKVKQNELEEIIANVADDVRVRSTCQWYKEGEKSNKFFLNLEKQCESQGQIQKVIVDGKKNWKKKKWIR